MFTLKKARAGSPKGAKLGVVEEARGERGDGAAERLLAGERRFEIGEERRRPAGDQRLQGVPGGGDDERLGGVGEAAEQGRGHEREIAGDDDEGAPRMAERGDDPDQRMGGLLGLGDDLDVGECTAHPARLLGDDEGLDPGGGEGGERVGDQRPAGQLHGRLAAAEAAAPSARQDHADRVHRASVAGARTAGCAYGEGDRGRGGAG